MPKPQGMAKLVDGNKKQVFAWEGIEQKG
jgi:hypothetical protein